MATVVPGPKAKGAEFRKATCILVLTHCRKNCLFVSKSVEFVAVLEAVLSFVAMISSLSVALAVAIQAPLAPKLSYASVAISD